MEEAPVWLWPLVVCGLAFGLRIWAGRWATGRLGAAAVETPVAGGQGLFAAWRSGFAWLATRTTRGLTGHGENPPRDAIRVLSRKVLTAQQSLVLVEIWDQQLLLGIQPGVAPAVLATRESAGQDADLRKLQATAPAPFSQHLHERCHPGAREERPCA